MERTKSGSESAKMEGATEVILTEQSRREAQTNTSAQLTNFKPASRTRKTTQDTMSAHPLSHLAPIRHQLCHRPPPLRDEKSALSNRQEPVPMHDTEIIRGWKGVSEKEPLAREGMLPAVVRGWPRAYLVPPRRNIYRSTAEEYGYVSDDFESHLTGRSPLPHGCVDFHTLKATYEEDSDSC